MLKLKPNFKMIIMLCGILCLCCAEKEKLPAGTYCYPTPDICSYQPGEWPPGFIPADIVEGDFDGDGDQDVIYSADLGDRRFKALGYPEGAALRKLINPIGAQSTCFSMMDRPLN